ncbi:hypothetical protein ABDK00_016955 [Niabella insulamsoli]|uniref:hypothetical protein n=1 Tax=Niabella insulamsoli TaxID=3144874 RepID=UPI0031FCD9FC
MDILIKDIQNRLSAEIPALKYVDEDWGQLDDYSPNPPVKWPCALIDINHVLYSNAGRHSQLGEATITISVADIKLTNSSSKAPAGQKQKQTDYLQLIKSIHIALHGWHGHNHYSSLIRTIFKRVKRDDGVRQHLITYTCQIQDTDSVKPTIKVPAALELIVEAPKEI